MGCDGDVGVAIAGSVFMDGLLTATGDGVVAVVTVWVAIVVDCVVVVNDVHSASTASVRGWRSHTVFGCFA